MEPRIQYAQTKDGVSIAYATLGEGAPLVFMPFVPSHIQLFWGIPEVRRLLEHLAKGRRLVLYDNRGSGLSDRDVADHSIEGHLLDLEAVAGRLELERFYLMAIGRAAQLAIAYAARTPERVARLVLGSAFARASDLAGAPVQATRTLLDTDWELYTETMAQYYFGWSEAKQAQKWAAYLREATTPDAARALAGAEASWDVADLLSQVRSPTLVLHPRQLLFIPVEVAKGIASRIPDARLVLVEGRALGAERVNFEAVARAIDEFLGEGEEAEEAGAPEAGAFRTVLFTDVEGSTALTQRLGDAKARHLLREHERIVREALKAHGGSELKMMGDGFMASFSSAVRALESAIAMQRAFAAHNESAPEPIHVRVGMNAGEPIAEEAEPGREDLFGTAVIMAARIAAKAKGGEILTSDTVRGLVAGKRFLFSDRGETALRGFEDPVRLFELRWREEK